MSLITWSWIFLVISTALILFLGFVGMRRTTSADSFATARGSYGGLLLGLGFMTMIASGSTFLGMPGLAYEYGFKSAYYPLLYPVGAYLGVILVARLMKRKGDRLGSVSVPDFLGDFFRSPILRAGAALFSLFLIYYVMAQLAASGQVFETLFGISYQWGLIVVMVITLIYMIAGGTHSDIITDAVQGLFMLVIAVIIIGGFLIGYGVDGFGPAAINQAIPSEMQWDVHTDASDSTFANWWVILLLPIAHLGFIMQPHLGTKFFALRGTSQVRRFVVTSSLAGIMVSFMFLGGILARANGVESEHPDAILPTLFVDMLPAWLAAMLGVAVLSAIISTSDGLLMSISQIFANDLYRKTWVPWRGHDPKDPVIDRRALLIGRLGILGAGIVAVAAVWTPPELLAVWMWVGIGGVISALSGPVALALWSRQGTALGAILGGLSGIAVYTWLHLGPQFGFYEGIFPWNDNPFASTAVGMLTGVVACRLFSQFGKKLPKEHLDYVNREENDGERTGVSA